MIKYVLNSTVKYRVATVAEALELRKELQNLTCGKLTGFSYVTKQIKVKGEVQEEYQVVTAKIDFNSEKDPEDSCINVEYTDTLREANF